MNRRDALKTLAAAFVGFASSAPTAASPVIATMRLYSPFDEIHMLDGFDHYSGSELYQKWSRS